MRSLIATAMLCLATVALAHDGHHDHWFKSLTNQVGVSCCDGSDAVRVDDPDWEVSGQAYRVRIEGVWLEVPPARVVRRPNIIGVAIVWPYIENGTIAVRCFLPGSGA